MTLTDLAHLETWDSKSGCLNVIIETPKGSRNKFEYKPEGGLFELSKVLPKGLSFPYDFGFVPSTKGEDGDLLDVLVLMDEPAFTGCKVRCRLIGVIEAEQTNKHGETVRNDRLIAVADRCENDKGTRSVKQLPNNLRAFGRNEKIGSFSGISVISSERSYGGDRAFLHIVSWHRREGVQGVSLSWSQEGRETGWRSHEAFPQC